MWPVCISAMAVIVAAAPPFPVPFFDPGIWWRIDADDIGSPAPSARTKACEYTLKLWNRLTRFLDHPELELSNNAVENSMRPVAMSRKNWIHVGSEQAGPRVAAIISIVETCRRLRIPVREYLSAVLPGLENRFHLGRRAPRRIRLAHRLGPREPR